jgi:hypothetical protein
MNLQLNVEPIETCDCKTIAILDTSYYPVAPLNPTLVIEMPGFNPIQFAFVTGQVNTYNSYSLGLSSPSTIENLMDLPDGLYTLTYSVDPNDMLFQIKSYMRTCQIEYKFAQKFARTVNYCETDSSFMRKLQQIEVLIEGAKANARVCNPTKAVELYRKANELLDRLDTKCCHC